MVFFNTSLKPALSKHSFLHSLDKEAHLSQRVPDSDSFYFASEDLPHDRAPAACISLNCHVLIACHTLLGL